MIRTLVYTTNTRTRSFTLLQLCRRDGPIYIALFHSRSGRRRVASIELVQDSHRLVHRARSPIIRPTSGELFSHGDYSSICRAPGFTNRTRSHEHARAAFVQLSRHERLHLFKQVFKRVAGGGSFLLSVGDGDASRRIVQSLPCELFRIHFEPREICHRSSKHLRTRQRRGCAVVDVPRRARDRSVRREFFFSPIHVRASERIDDDAKLIRQFKSRRGGCRASRSCRDRKARLCLTHHLCRFSTERNGFVKTNTRLLVGNWRAQSSMRLLTLRMRALHRADTRRDSIASNASIMSCVSGGALCKRNPSFSSLDADRASALPSRSPRGAPPSSTPAVVVVVVRRGSRRRPDGGRGMRRCDARGRLESRADDATRARVDACGAPGRRCASSARRVRARVDLSWGITHGCKNEFG